MAWFTLEDLPHHRPKLLISSRYFKGPHKLFFHIFITKEIIPTDDCRKLFIYGVNLAKKRYELKL
jgi:hypothetical protein